MPASKKRVHKTGPSANKSQPVVNAREGDEDRYAPTAWGGSSYEDLYLPSGQCCLARKVGIQGLLEAGVIHDLDPLMPLVQGHQKRVKGEPIKELVDEEAALEIMKDKSLMTTMLHMLDRILCHVVVKPQVEMAPNDVTRRESGKIYTDMVDLQDKMYIMAWTMGGTEALQSFRSELPGLVGGVSTEPADEDPAE